MPTQNVSMSDWVYTRIRKQQDELGGSFSHALGTLIKVADAHLAYLADQEKPVQSVKDVESSL